mmetsp:Transcript_14089/g.39433  ORF Transcript_14089/g.39433 Transcript_14089/m.39433 type:complete len:218 (-) Transcript_14089:69-722(-)
MIPHGVGKIHPRLFRQCSQFFLDVSKGMLDFQSIAGPRIVGKLRSLGRERVVVFLSLLSTVLESLVDGRPDQIGLVIVVIVLSLDAGSSSSGFGGRLGVLPPASLLRTSSSRSKILVGSSHFARSPSGTGNVSAGSRTPGTAAIGCRRGRCPRTATECRIAGVSQIAAGLKAGGTSSPSGNVSPRCLSRSGAAGASSRRIVSPKHGCVCVSVLFVRR